MSLESSAELLWGIGALVLAVSALIARRPSRNTILRSLLAWLLIGAVIVLAVVSVYYLSGTAEENEGSTGSGSAALVLYSAAH
ncbi:hypothetical protein [Sphingomonas sp. ACRSK]|uniref:hypothetical protein n=1 Tax=Sphingomonas sp. ACRSK TaxID=2918213 RepID=UPI001EF4797E|nr:hypothetical protein [Sphingomonas sp. ACRSK]MCG7348725.1 hypothetical protein [Sphingomonas sp. ACRSK]